MPGTLPGAGEAAAETLKDQKATTLPLGRMLVKRLPMNLMASWILERPEGSMAEVGMTGIRAYKSQSSTFNGLCPDEP